jgi:coenzyme F420-0:L-glutamate ligase/coenzyme F420-1:gamma-L-glutamate ligase
MTNPLHIIPLTHIGEITTGTSLTEVISSSLQKQQLILEDHDILVITQKIVSKAEGRIINLDDVIPSTFAKEFAKKNHKDAAHVEVILRESKRIVRMDHGVIISETHNGFICANAGVDESNVTNNRTVTLLPINPDASAKKLHDTITKQTHIKDIGVIISDTWGRPWREGQVNFAIGTYGFAPLIDYRGQKDTYGYTLKVSSIAVADELASAAELVMGKTDQIPVALVRGYHVTSSEANGKALLRNPATDMFR